MITPNLIKMRRDSILEFTLWTQLDQADLPMPTPQVELRGHRVDFAWGEPWMLIVEVQGGTRGLGRHSREPGYSQDRARSNQYQLDGWTVFEFTSGQVNDGTALRMIREAIERVNSRCEDWMLGEDI